ncbi:hypothetical protein ACJ41O_005514 [Fusarium nematophilum]
MRHQAICLSSINSFNLASIRIKSPTNTNTNTNSISNSTNMFNSLRIHTHSKRNLSTLIKARLPNLPISSNTLNTSTKSSSFRLFIRPLAHPQQQPQPHQQHTQQPQHQPHPSIAANSTTPTQPNPAHHVIPSEHAVKSPASPTHQLQHVMSDLSSFSLASADDGRHPSFSSTSTGVATPGTTVTTPSTLASPKWESASVSLATQKVPAPGLGRVPSGLNATHSQACNHCRKAIPSNVSIYTCLVCSTAQITTAFCVWCFTSNAATSHPHDKSYYVTESDPRVQPSAPDPITHLWTIRKNVSGRIWYTHNSTGLKTHIKPTAAALSGFSGLPEGWETRKTPDGRTFFFNRRMGASSWTKPANSLPDGWKELRTPDLMPFYVNEKLGLSTWDRPGQQPRQRQGHSTRAVVNRSKPGQRSAGHAHNQSAADSVLSATINAARLTGVGVEMASRQVGKLGKKKNWKKMGRMMTQVGGLGDGFDSDGGYGEQSDEEGYENEGESGGLQGQGQAAQYQQTQQPDYPQQQQQPAMAQGNQPQPVFQQPVYEQQPSYQYPTQQEQPVFEPQQQQQQQQPAQYGAAHEYYNPQGFEQQQPQDQYAQDPQQHANQPQGMSEQQQQYPYNQEGQQPAYQQQPGSEQLGQQQPQQQVYQQQPPQPQPGQQPQYQNNQGQPVHQPQPVHQQPGQQQPQPQFNQATQQPAPQQQPQQQAYQKRPHHHSQGNQQQPHHHQPHEQHPVHQQPASEQPVHQPVPAQPPSTFDPILPQQQGDPPQHIPNQQPVVVNQAPLESQQPLVTQAPVDANQQPVYPVQPVFEPAPQPQATYQTYQDPSYALYATPLFSQSRGQQPANPQPSEQPVNVVVVDNSAMDPESFYVDNSQFVPVEQQVPQNAVNEPVMVGGNEGVPGDVVTIEQPQDFSAEPGWEVFPASDPLAMQEYEQEPVSVLDMDSTQFQGDMDVSADCLALI